MGASHDGTVLLFVCLSPEMHAAAAARCYKPFYLSHWNADLSNLSLSYSLWPAFSFNILHFIVCTSSQTVIYRHACIYSLVQNGFFAPQGRQITLIKVKFHLYRDRNVGIQPPKQSNFCILAINLPLRRDWLAQFLRSFQRLYASLGRF